MKLQQSIKIALLLSILISGSAFSQRTTPSGVDTIHCELNRRGVIGENAFEVKPLTSTEPGVFFSHLWWSGDNGFSFVSKPVHTHVGTRGVRGYPNVKMTAVTTKHYGSGGPPPLTYSFRTEEGRPSSQWVLGPDTSIFMQRYRNAVSNDTTYLIVTYKNLSDSIVEGTLRFNVGRYASIVGTMFRSHSHFLPNGEEWNPSSNIITYQNLSPGEERSVLVPVLIHRNASGQLTMRVEFIAGNKSPKEWKDAVNVFSITLEVARSHDPNQMLAYSNLRSPNCNNRNRRIHYVTQFQNVGKGPTDYVRVECFLDANVDMESISGITFPRNYPSARNGSILGRTDRDITEAIYSIDVANRKIIFEMHGMVLYGTADRRLRNLELSRAQVEFDILIKDDYVFGPAIVAYSEIYFDDNRPIKTNEADVVCGISSQKEKNGDDQQKTATFSITRLWYIIIYLVIAIIVGLIILRLIRKKS